MLRMARPDPLRWILHWLSNSRYCAPEVYESLVSTPGMRESSPPSDSRTQASGVARALTGLRSQPSSGAEGPLVRCPAVARMDRNPEAPRNQRPVRLTQTSSCWPIFALKTQQPRSQDS